MHSHAVLFRFLMLSCLCSLPTFTLLLSLVVVNGGSECNTIKDSLAPRPYEGEESGACNGLVHTVSACATSCQYDVQMPNTFIAWLFQLNDSVPLCCVTLCSQSDVCPIAH